jgi:hypothetical protein
VKLLFNKKYIIIVTILLLIGCNESQSVEEKIIYTSDIHFSLPDGRYNFMTQRFKELLKLYSSERNIYFINGDFIDNAYINNEQIVAGDLNRQKKETKYFLDSTREIISLKNSKLLLNFGTGHDFGNLTLAEELTNQKSIGHFKWGEVNLVWFTVTKAAFKNDNNSGSTVLTNKEYMLLEDMLQNYKNILLFSHIPLRTQKTFTYGKWANGMNLTIPSDDQIYQIINENKKNILAIFTGHIHTVYVDNYEEIPIFSFPFIEHNSYCEIVKYKKHITIFPKNVTMKNFKIPLMK